MSIQGIKGKRVGKFEYQGSTAAEDGNVDMKVTHTVESGEEKKNGERYPGLYMIVESMCT